MSQTQTVTATATVASGGPATPHPPEAPEKARLTPVRPAEAFELSRTSFGSGRRVGGGGESSSAEKPRKSEAAGEVVGGDTPDASSCEAGSGPATPPADAHGESERWNRPRGNVGRLVFVFLTFIIAGMNDGAVGALIPSLEEYYNLSYTLVSLIFLTPFAGYSVAAFTNARIHVAFGQRGVAVMAPLCHIVTFVVLSLHPPYPALVVFNALSGFGNGLCDAAFCAWVGAMDKANTIQGFMHACYSLGALFAPLIATNMVVTVGLPWYTYYYIMIGVSVLELVGLSIFFWHKTGAVYRAQHVQESDENKGAGTREALKSKVTWLCSIFFFCYMGVEVGLGGWVVTFMLRVRNASAYDAGVSGSGFWAGMAAGRAALGMVTERFGERLSVIIYLVLSIGLQLIFWLVPHFIVSAVAVSFLGFFLGPLFPGAVMMTAKLLPKRIHVSAIGFAMAIGGTGGTVFPFIVGAIANSKGVGVLQPVVLALIAVVTLVWLSFPRIKKKD